MKKLLLALLCTFCIMGTFSQALLEGTVTDEDAMPLPGVSVFVKGTSTGAITDLDGAFSIASNSSEGRLIFSFIGMRTMEIGFNGNQRFQIVMESEAIGLEEVVAIGYGTVRRKDLTGAVSSVSAENIQMAPTSNPIEAIQGSVAGFDISRNDGRANSGTYIQMRGNRSLNFNTPPLYIIDGIKGSINNLNPADIETMDILKDASSTAIYGSEGANGVILITTKRAEEGQMKVDFSSYVSINSWPTFPRALQGDAWFDYLTEGYRASYDTIPDDRDDLLSTWGMSPSVLNPYIDSSKWIDWIDESMGRGMQTNSNLAIQSGNEKVRSRFSLGYNRTEGVYKNDYVDKLTLRENLDMQVTRRAKFGIISGLSFRNSETRPSRINKSFGMIPLGDVYNEDGEINQYPIDGMTDVISVLADNIDGTYRSNSKSFSITANPYAEILLSEGLSFKSILGTSLSASRSGVYNSDHTYMMLSGSQTAIRNASYGSGLSYNYTWENILNYKRVFAQDHDLDLTLISSYSNSQYENSGMYSEGFLYDDFLFYNLDAGVNPNLYTNYGNVKRLSYAARLSYIFKGKYLLTANFRRDGTSELADGHNWDNFPGMALAWRISDEAFMASTGDWLTNLKLRVGYGVSGNAAIGEYKVNTEVTNGVDPLNLGGGELLTNVPTEIFDNPILGWEKSYNLNIGLDFGLFKNRIDGALELYDTDTRNAIYARPLPFSGGGFGPKQAYTVYANIAGMRNRGIELSLNSRNVRKGDFQWNSSFTFARNWEEITRIDLGSGTTVDDLISLGLFMGEPKNTFYDYNKVGIWQEDEAEDAAVFGLLPGDVKVETSLTKREDGVWYKMVEDEEGNMVEQVFTPDSLYVINATADRQIIGQGTPKWTAGFQNYFYYKGFDLGILMTARWGHMLDADLLGYFDYGNLNIPANYDYWTESNPTNDFPRPYRRRTTVASASDLGLNYVDGSYLKIKNITLGYTFKPSFITRAGIADLRVYSTVYNALVFSRSHLLNGIDPENGAKDSFPLYKQVVFGVNVSF